MMSFSCLLADNHNDLYYKLIIRKSQVTSPLPHPASYLPFRTLRLTHGYFFFLILLERRVGQIAVSNRNETSFVYHLVSYGIVSKWGQFWLCETNNTSRSGGWFKAIIMIEIYIALYPKVQSAITTLCWGLCQTAFTGANCGHTVYNLIMITVGFTGAPRTEQSDRPSHRPGTTVVRRSTNWANRSANQITNYTRFSHRYILMN